ncbi:hypothetical protein IKP94_00800, partial [Candidatus Saccharibacteria bacterium]|nr:hypothetical protein [Candidatus Saccharibacteria bacterium]
TSEYEFLKELSRRSGETDRKVTQIVTEIIDTVREGGDEELDGQQSGAPFGTPLIFFSGGHRLYLAKSKKHGKITDI